MAVGYGIIAVPTGIVTSEMMHPPKPAAGENCPCCGRKTDAIKITEIDDAKQH